MFRLQKSTLNVLCIAIIAFVAASVDSQIYDPIAFGGHKCFNGTDAQVVLPNSSLNNLTAGTVELWVMFNTLTGPGNDIQFMVTRGWDSTNWWVSDLFLGIAPNTTGSNTGKFFFSLNNGDQTLYSTTAPIANQWYHVAVTWNGTVWSIYVNGSLENSLMSSRTLPNNPLGIIKVGWIVGNTPPGFLNGGVDEVRFSSVARLPSEFCLSSPCSSDGLTLGLWHLDNWLATTIVDSSANHFDGTSFGTVCGSCTDTDGDGFGDPGYPANTCPTDNCPLIANASQTDADGDGVGDVCDLCTDIDGDGFGDPGYPTNTCPVDNCPSIANASQADADGDGIGDVCDLCTDTDDDDFGNPGYAANLCPIDNCPTSSNPSQLDSDQDGIGDICDATGCCVKEGDFNHNGAVNIVDVTSCVQWLFSGGAIYACLLEADVTDNGSVNVVDLTTIVTFLFSGGSVGLCP